MNSPDEETPLLHEQVNQPSEHVSETTKKLNPYTILLPFIPFIFTAVMAQSVLQQWLIIYLCQRYVNADGTVIESALTGYLPGVFSSGAILLENPSFDFCRTIPQIQVLASRYDIFLSLLMGLPSLGTILLP